VPVDREDLKDAMKRLIPTRQRSIGDILGAAWAPRVVALGGGTGLSVLLRGLKERTHRVTAVVTVADDGGSSGRLRDELGMLPPGDIRSCLVALAEAEPLMRRLFQYRFDQGHGLQGHTFGNLFIAAMTEITGDFQEAVRLSSRVLAVKGRVLPATLEHVTLAAEMEDGRVVDGETAITGARGTIRRVWLEPNCSPVPETLSAIAEADMVVIGPGSLYTSVLPTLVVSGVAEAIARSRAVKVYVANVMTQPGETDGYRVSDHVRAIIDHAGTGVIGWVAVNDAGIRPELAERYKAEGSEPVVLDLEVVRRMGVSVLQGDLVEQGEYARHDPEKLAEALFSVLPAARANWRRWVLGGSSDGGAL